MKRVGFVYCAVAAVLSIALPFYGLKANPSDDAVAIRLLDKFRKGGNLPVPAFTATEDGSVVPSNLKEVRIVLRGCVDNDPLLMHPLNTDKGFRDSDVNLFCDSSEKTFGARFQFTLAGELKRVTFYLDGIKYREASAASASGIRV